MRIFPPHAIDFYKTGHRVQYPQGTEMVYSNFTPRSGKHSPISSRFFTNQVVVFGLQFFIQDFLINTWNEEFFKKDKTEVIERYRRRMDTSLGQGAIPVDHLEALHDLGYLPITIKALPEGSVVPFGVPVLTVWNTHKDFYWLTNYLETVISCYLWKPMTSATIALHYRLLLDHYAKLTSDAEGFVQFQAHDFSFRGMSGPQDATLSGAAHLTSFVGTDTVSAIDFLEDFYHGDASKELLGCSVPASEHSVMCMGGMDGEIDTFKRFLTELYPKGIVSIVSDTWDFWQVVTEFVVTLKEEILARDGKLVIRPDSGDPVKIICGDRTAPPTSPAHYGAVAKLWEVFGGKVNSKGFKELDPHIGVIYGDSITIERAGAICEGLQEMGFASTNVVLGVGSYTYQHVTRDSFGLAMKSTYGVVNGEGREIFKSPKTDDGTKNSARGLLAVHRGPDGKYVLADRQTAIVSDEMRTVFHDGALLDQQTIADIRQRLQQVR